ncbi:MAG: TrkH family potassium uptake protein [Bacillaceae bacterium]
MVRFRRFLTPVRLIVLYYVLAVSISVILLSLPIAHKPGVVLPFSDALFTSISAISVTGLSVISISDTFNTFGIILLAIVLQFGGIGIMMLGTLVYLTVGKRIGFVQRRLIMTDQNRTSLSGMVAYIKETLKIIVGIEIIGMILLTIRYLYYFDTPGEAFIQGFFGSVSATTNAGFDITGESLIPFKNDYFVQSVQMILMIAGAIGFPVLIELKTYIQSKKKHTFRFSLFTKLTTATFFILVFGGMIMILLFEANHFLADKTWPEKIFYSLFQSVTTRNAGLATMDVGEFSLFTQLFLGLLMFIGASPSSVGGGVRTTTFAVNLLFLISVARGSMDVRIFGRQLYREDVFKAVAVTMFATILCFIGIITLTITEKLGLNEIVFEVCSAFGTTGLSLGITDELSEIGRVIIMILMFIGRIGILSSLYMFSGNGRKEYYEYPKEKLVFG